MAAGCGGGTGAVEPRLGGLGPISPGLPLFMVQLGLNDIVFAAIQYNVFQICWDYR